MIVVDNAKKKRGRKIRTPAALYKLYAKGISVMRQNFADFIMDEGVIISPRFLESLSFVDVMRMIERGDLYESNS